jgi:transcriptional regulator with XRE-family HTH domain
MRLGKALKLYRVTAGKTDRELGDEIGVSAATVCRIENGLACDMRSFAKLLAWLVDDDARTAKEKER